MLSEAPAPLLGLQQILKRIPRMALAFSGGLDSRFLAFAARHLGSDVHLFLVAGSHIAPADTDFAQTWAAENGFPAHRISWNPFLSPEIASNSRSRCYSCKKAMLAMIREEAGKLPGVWRLCDGTQADDLSVFRPGHRALREAGVMSPLALANLTKARISHLAASMGMDAPCQKARPCLLTRLAYGMCPSSDLLSRVAACEERLQKLLEPVADFRLRLTPEPLLQTSVDIGQLRTKARVILAEYGFARAGFVVTDKISGFFD